MSAKKKSLRDSLSPVFRKKFDEVSKIPSATYRETVAYFEGVFETPDTKKKDKS